MKSVVPVEIEGMPTQDLSDMESSQSKLSINKHSSGGILVSIQTRDGLHIRCGNLDYRGLVDLVEKLEGLRNFYYFPHFHDMCCKAPIRSVVASVICKLLK